MSPVANSLAWLSPEESGRLLRWIGDSPFTALTAGQLKGGFCRAYALGAPEEPAVAVVQSAVQPTEPIAFGTDAGALWALLSRIPGWDCVNVAPGVEGDVAALFGAKLGASARIKSERYYALEGQPIEFPRPEVRRLGPEDLSIVEGSDPLFRSFFLGHGDAIRTLARGVVAGVVSGGKLLSAITTSTWSGVHVDLGAATVPEARRRGLATAAASLVCSKLRTAGLTPVWSALESNVGSWRVPEKLDFRFVGRREYVVFESLRPDGFQPR